MMNQKRKTKKFCAIMASLLVIAIFAVFIGYKEWQKIEEQYNTKLKWAYQNETRAFAMDRSDCYKDYSYVDVNSLIINLASYKHFKNEVDISVEDVKEYLSSEYDDNGEPYVLNPPENIAKYIRWFSYGGSSLTGRYFIYLCNFQDDNIEKYSRKGLTILDEDLLYELIEDFENCPNREDYENY
jgi:hypothetical protein